MIVRSVRDKRIKPIFLIFMFGLPTIQVILMLSLKTIDRVGLYCWVTEKDSGLWEFLFLYLWMVNARDFLLILGLNRNL